MQVYNSDSWSVVIIILGLVILLAAVVAAVAGVLSKGGSGHAPARDPRSASIRMRS
jgi:flagellar basal body-associated protein FliL